MLVLDRLVLDRVSSGYGAARVLWELSLTVGRGEAVALLGRNGMGKTTALRTIMGLNRVRGGRITLDGHHIGSLRPFEIARRGVGYSPEGRRVFRTLSVIENLRIPFIHKGADRRRWRTHVDRMLTMFPALAASRSRTAGTLSGGEQQMLAIARALVSGDQLLILDEPTEGLAPSIVRTIVETLRALTREGLSMLMVEQNVDAALASVDRVYVLEKGRIAMAASAGEVERDRSMLLRHLGAGV